MLARRLLVVELIPTALLAAAVAWGLWGFSYDDSWITYRYADNWAQGRGLVFNPGEAILGTTAPGWALALGALSRASAAIGLSGMGVPEWGTLLTVAALWWLAAALPALWLPAGSRLRPGLPLVLGTLALTCRWNLELLGGEAFPAAALAATAVWLALGRRPETRIGRLGDRQGESDSPGSAREASAAGAGSMARARPGAGEGAAGGAGGTPRTSTGSRETLAGLAVAAAMLCRLDAGLAAAALGLALWIVRRRFAWRFAVAGLAPLLPYLIWLQLAFGTILPNTLAAKQSEAATAMRGYGAWEWVWLERSFGTVGRWWLLALAAAGVALLIGQAVATRRRRRSGLGSGEAAPPSPSAEPASAGPTSARSASVRSASAGPSLAVLATWIVLHELFYRLTGVPFAPWYCVVTLLAALALAVFAAVSLGGWLAISLRHRLATAPPAGVAWAERPLATALAALLTLPILLPGLRFLAATWDEPPDIRTRLYAAVGDHLRQHSPPGARVAAMEIGALAYASDRPVLDLIGLVDPEVVEARRTGRLPEHVAAEAPEYILVPPPFLGRELGDVMRHPEIRARYVPVERFYDPDYEHDPVRLYRRRERRALP